VALEAQPLDAIPLIRRKRGGEGESAEASPSSAPEIPSPSEELDRSPDMAAALQMKPRETVQLAAVHVRIPEQLARGLRLMSVLEGRQAQVIVAEMLEEHLTRWNPKWRDSVPQR
jgi:hypothetical protein